MAQSGQCPHRFDPNIGLNFILQVMAYRRQRRGLPQLSRPAQRFPAHFCRRMGEQRRQFIGKNGWAGLSQLIQGKQRRRRLGLVERLAQHGLAGAILQRQIDAAEPAPGECFEQRNRIFAANPNGGNHPAGHNNQQHQRELGGAAQYPVKKEQRRAGQTNGSRHKQALGCGFYPDPLRNGQGLVQDI